MSQAPLIYCYFSYMSNYQWHKLGDTFVSYIHLSGFDSTDYFGLWNPMISDTGLTNSPPPKKKRSKTLSLFHPKRKCGAQIYQTKSSSPLMVVDGNPCITTNYCNRGKFHDRIFMNFLLCPEGIFHNLRLPWVWIWTFGPRELGLWV